MYHIFHDQLILVVPVLVTSFFSCGFTQIEIRNFFVCNLCNRCIPYIPFDAYIVFFYSAVNVDSIPVNLVQTIFDKFEDRRQVAHEFLQVLPKAAGYNRRQFTSSRPSSA